ncbi:eukaryotic translation initiation factor 4E-binding protein 1-like [Saccostrea echinata]|uniref:eukaryotic translation initiation factor 4E-binding protein 1-like n=1 Tax=Saccostrea echinata TaxID=191078 RepID=UPI002A825BDE|nr:eukaryotic translation initiation factor 4E-binding protein 1-like [Saccostrea echinata]
MSSQGSPQQLVSGREIPKRAVLNDLSQLPHDYSTTPGGSIFSTTPGGTKIFYDRSFLLKCRNSPLTKSPPPNMAKIPGVTAPASENIPKENGTDVVHDENQKKKEGHEDQPQFEMDI